MKFPMLGNHKQRRDLAHALILHSDACAFPDLLKFLGDIFHLDRRHLLSADINNIVSPAHHINESLVIHVYDVIRVQPAIHQRLRGCFRHPEVSGHLHISPQDHPASRIDVPRGFRNIIAFLVHDPYFHAVQRLSERCELIPVKAEIQENSPAALRRAPGIDYPRIRQLRDQLFLHIISQGTGSHLDIAQLSHNFRKMAAHLTVHQFHRGRHADHRRTLEFRNIVVDRLGKCKPFLKYNRAAHIKPGTQRPHAKRMVQRQRDQNTFVLQYPDALLHIVDDRVNISDRQHRSLRLSCRACGKQDLRNG